MITLPALWLPIVVSTVLVWMASALVWMALPHHKSDFRGVPDEGELLSGLRKRGLSPGQYWFPYYPDQKSMKTPEAKQKLEDGPVGLLTIWPSGMPKMGKSIGLSAIFYLVVSSFTAYVAGRTLLPGTEYLHVFRVTGTVAFVAYAAALVPDAIWFGRPWSNTWKMVADGALYGLLTAGVFGWLWPE